MMTRFDKDDFVGIGHNAGMIEAANHIINKLNTELCPTCKSQIEQETARRIRALFLKYLTQDSETKDRRRKEFNQAIFNANGGWQVFNNTDLDMVMEKFEKAIEEYGL